MDAASDGSPWALAEPGCEGLPQQLCVTHGAPVAPRHSPAAAGLDMQEQEKRPVPNPAAVKTSGKSIAGNHRSTEPMVGAPQVLKGAVGGEAPWTAPYISSDSLGWHFLCSNSTPFPNSFYQTVPAKGDP